MSYKSSTIQYYIIRYLLILISVFLMAIGWYIRPSDTDYPSGLIIMITGIFCFGFWFFANTRVAIVTLDSEKILIKRGRNVKTVSWNEIQKITIIPITNPLMYRIYFRDDRSSVLFMQEDFSTTFNLGYNAWDWTDMGKFIKKMNVKMGEI